MEPMTTLVLAFQLLALFSIAGALLVYLMCKVRDDTDTSPAETQSDVVLVTSADTALGMQLCVHLANKGCRVFAGMKELHDSLSAKLIANWLKQRESAEVPVRGYIIPLKLDVTREDVLREATIAMGAHLNAGERGIGAVINTSGSLFRGRVEFQDVQQWEHMLKTNILGSLRVAKTFLTLLRPTHGRLIYLGAGDCHDDGLVAFNASRVAVEKCAEELRKEFQPYGVSVIALDTCGMSAETLFKAPVPQVGTDHMDEGGPTQYSASVLDAHALQVIESALWANAPLKRYHLVNGQGAFKFMRPFCSSMHRITSNDAVQDVQTI